MSAPTSLPGSPSLNGSPIPTGFSTGDEVDNFTFSPNANGWRKERSASFDATTALPPPDLRPVSTSPDPVSSKPISATVVSENLVADNVFAPSASSSEPVAASKKASTVAAKQ